MLTISLFSFTGAHTNNVENCWRWAKAYIRLYGRATSDAHLHYHLTAYTWRKSRGETNPLTVFAQLVQDIALLYPVWISQIQAKRCGNATETILTFCIPLWIPSYYRQPKHRAQLVIFQDPFGFHCGVFCFIFLSCAHMGSSLTAPTF